MFLSRLRHRPPSIRDATAYHQNPSADSVHLTFSAVDGRPGTGTHSRTQPPLIRTHTNTVTRLCADSTRSSYNNRHGNVQTHFHKTLTHTHTHTNTRFRAITLRVDLTHSHIQIPDFGALHYVRTSAMNHARSAIYVRVASGEQRRSRLRDGYQSDSQG